MVNIDNKNVFTAEKLRKTEEELQKIKEHDIFVSNIIEYTSQPFGVGYPDGRLGLVNKAFEELTGYSKEELKNTNWSEILTPSEFQDMENEKLEELQRTDQPIKYEKEYIRKDGTRVPIELLVHLVKNEDGTPKYYYSFITDITERKKAEDEQNKLSKQLQLALDAANMGWWHYDPITDISTYDNRYKEIFGVLGSKSPNEEILKLLHPDDLPGVWANVEEALDPVNPRKYYAEYRIYRNNEIHWIEAHGIATFEGYGNKKHAVSLVGTVNDITERKRSEKYRQKLLEKEQQLTEELTTSNKELQSTTEELYKLNEKLQNYSKMLSTIYELNPDAIVLTTLSESKIIDCNQEYLNQIGYTREETIGHTSLELNLLSSNTRKDYIDKTRGNNKVSHYELKVRRKDGSLIDVFYSARQITVNNEQVILNIGHDITKRKQNEEQRQKLLENEQQLTEELQVINNELIHQGDELLKINKELEMSEDRFHTLADNIPNLVWMAQANGEIFWYNQQWYDYTGTTLEEMQIWGWQKVHHQDYVDSVTEEWSKKIKEGKPYENILPLKGKDGNYRWFLTRMIPIKNGKNELIRWFGTNTDITEYKIAEEKIQQQADLISQSFDALIVGQLNGGIESWNHGAEELYGYTESEAVGKPIYELLNTSFPLQWSKISEKIENGGIWEGEVKHRAKNGQTVIVSSRIQNIILNDGSTKLLETNRDITKRKRSEEHIIKLLEEEQQLTEELSATNEELQATSEELQSSNEELMRVQNNLREMINKLKISNKELEQFAYVASHDLQEPLRMVSSFTQLLERRYKTQLDTDADDYIGFVVEGAKRMKDLIDDLLEFSRLNTEGREFEPILMELNLDDVLRNLKASIKEHNAQITHEPLPCIKGDPVQINQLLQNLIGNAIKFHGDKPPQIHISAQNMGNEWIFSIKDNGIGIDLRHQEQIFNIFKRLHTREEYEGTGIGLSICKRIVERHSGHIWLESEPGKGSTFFFNIPSY
ncbi:PAS domain S-box protein [Methanobacterium sp.]|uniref:PAS domain S-box protein n=1 Tax=Methanobacterium sp. TaxID=2164 RepID=UPI003C76883A